MPILSVLEPHGHPVALLWKGRSRHADQVPIRTKRWNDPADAEDGFRLLICRYRPRGVTHEAEPWDAWCIALAPSVELHAAAYGKEAPPIEWEAYERRFLEEMKRQRYWIDSFASRARAGETITLLCSSACIDPARCHRTLVKRLMERALEREEQRTAALPETAAKPMETGRVILRRRP